MSVEAPVVVRHSQQPSTAASYSSVTHCCLRCASSSNSQHKIHKQSLEHRWKLIPIPSQGSSLITRLQNHVPSCFQPFDDTNLTFLPTQCPGFNMRARASPPSSTSSLRIWALSELVSGLPQGSRRCLTWYHTKCPFPAPFHSPTGYSAHLPLRRWLQKTTEALTFPACGFALPMRVGC